MPTFTNLISKLNSSALIIEPFPHIIIDDFLDQNHYNSISECYPSRKSVLNHSRNSIGAQRVDVSSSTILSCADEFDDCIVDLVRFFNSPDWVSACIRRFSPLIDNCNADILLNIQSAVRFTDTDFIGRSPKTSRLSTDFQFGYNDRFYPGLAPHIDDPAELIAGLFYFRSFDPDEGIGGDLVLYDSSRCSIHKGHVENYGSLKPSKIVSYKSNRLVLFLNTSYSVHSVTPWVGSSDTNFRRVCNFLVETYNTPYRSYTYSDMNTSFSLKVLDCLAAIPRFLLKLLKSRCFGSRYTYSELWGELSPLTLLFK